MIINIFYFFSYPGNIEGETPHSGMANQLSSLNENFVSVHTVVGESGQPMTKLMKGATENGDTGY
jgi:hypothetical protein